MHPSSSSILVKLGSSNGDLTVTHKRSIHLTKRTEEVVTNPENAVWDPVREFYFRRYSLFDSLGLDFDDQYTDEFLARYFMFVGVSVLGVGMLFWGYYRPSYLRWFLFLAFFLTVEN